MNEIEQDKFRTLNKESISYENNKPITKHTTTIEKRKELLIKDDKRFDFSNFFEKKKEKDTFFKNDFDRNKNKLAIIQGNVVDISKLINIKINHKAEENPVYKSYMDLFKKDENEKYNDPQLLNWDKI